MDRKGILTYLAITLAGSAVIELICVLYRVPYLDYALLPLPAVGAIVAERVSRVPLYSPPQIRKVPRNAGFRIALVTPLLFALAFFLTTIVGLSRPDWRLGELMVQMPSAQELNLPPHIRLIYPLFMLGSGLVITSVLGPTIYAIAMLGMEYGWRGYLLPRLMPMGRWPACIMTTLLWSMTFVPLFAAHASEPYVAFGLQSAMALVIGLLLCRIWERSAHAGLCALVAGAIAVQVPGMWRFLFPAANVSAPWAGAVSVAMIAVWLVVAMFPEAVFGKIGSR